MKKTPILFLIFLTFSLNIFADEERATASEVAPVAKAVEKTEVAEGDVFTGEQVIIQKKLADLFDASKKINDKTESAKARNLIETSLDWDKVAQMCLGAAVWKKQSAKNMTEFKNLLKSVVLKTAYTRLDKFWQDGTTYKVQKIDIKGNDASTLSKFFVKGQFFSLEYFFSKKGRAWSIYDISYEKERYSVNISEQIEGFLREKSFAGLLEKLKKRQEELTEETKPKTANKEKSG